MDPFQNSFSAIKLDQPYQKVCGNQKLESCKTANHFSVFTISIAQGVLNNQCTQDETSNKSATFEHAETDSTEQSLEKNYAIGAAVTPTQVAAVVLLIFQLNPMK